MTSAVLDGTPDEDRPCRPALPATSRGASARVHSVPTDAGLPSGQTGAGLSALLHRRPELRSLRLARVLDEGVRWNV